MGMEPWKRKIFKNSPMRIRKLLANLEATKRVKTRRGGDYQAHYEQIDMEQILFKNHPEKKLNQLNQLLVACRSSIPYYREVLPEKPLLNMN